MLSLTYNGNEFYSVYVILLCQMALSSVDILIDTPNVPSPF